MSSRKKNNYIPKTAIRELAENVEISEQKGYSKSKKETFKHILSLMDKYREYFFSDEWPEKWDQEKATEFTAQDLAFINENDDEYRDRVMTVITKKSITKQGLNSVYASLVFNAFIDKFIKPDLLEVGKRFVDLAKTTQTPEDLLEKMLENPDNIDSYFIHESLIELLNDQDFDRKLEPIVVEVLLLIHKTEYKDCKDRTCEYYISKMKDQKKT
jgi:hypothetical protein